MYTALKIDIKTQLTWKSWIELGVSTKTKIKGYENNKSPRKSRVSSQTKSGCWK
jgi:hypothetical protein